MVAPTKSISDLIQSVQADVEHGRMSLDDALGRLLDTKAREILRLTMVRQSFCATPSERASNRNKERWQEANVQSLANAADDLAARLRRT
jgi:hypothetical protein